MKVRLRLLLRRLSKLTAVIVVAVAAGVALGIALSTLTDGGSTTSTAKRLTSTTTSTNSAAAARSTATASEPKTTSTVQHAKTTTRGTTRSSRPGASRVRVHVVSTVLHRGLTAVARRRNRARLAVHVRVVNHGKRGIANVKPLLIARAAVRANPAANDARGSLLRPVAPGSAAEGTLRFETAGAVTTRLVSTRRARLRIAGKTVRLTVQIGRPVRSRS